MTIRTVKQAAAAIDGLREQIKELAGKDTKRQEEWDAAIAELPIAPPEPSISAIEAGVEVLATSVKVLADKITELAANPPMPDGDALIKALESKGVMLRKS